MRLFRRGLERHLIGDGDAVAFERYDFARVIGEHANIRESEIAQDLRANSAFMLNHALARDVAIELLTRVIQNSRKGSARRGGGFDSEAASRVMQIDKHAAIFRCDGLQRARNNFAAIATRGTEDVSGEAVRMHAHERRELARFGCAGFTANERDVLFVIYITRKNDHLEFAEFRIERSFRDAANVAFVLHAIPDDFCDGDNFQAVPRGRIPVAAARAPWCRRHS